MDEFVICNGDTPVQIKEHRKRVEEAYGAKFLIRSQVTVRPAGPDGVWNLQGGAQFSEWPADIYYQTNPDTSKGHTHFFGIASTGGDLYIVGAPDWDKVSIPGLLIKGDEDVFLYSAYRHDYIEHLGSMVDGGRNYFRYRAGPGAEVRFINFTKDGQVHLLHPE